ncbi:MAG TPA: site-specific DNA-methyltransferase, partial [Rhodanobacteraceae bacterium]
ALNDDFVALEQDAGLSHGDAPWRNLIIEGDNYDALRALRMSHAGRIRCIYIDPPYNTGNRDFVYNDRFVDKAHRFRHSLWLEFMYKRLTLARDLLADDGVIFVSIDDNELFRLGMLMDRVFGEDNFIANVIWQKMDSPKNTAQHFSDDHEYLVVYSRNKVVWRPNRLPRSDEMNARYKNPDNDPRGPWLLSDLAARNYYGAGTYSITTRTGRVIEGPPTGNYWRVSREKFDELDRDNRIWWGKSGNNRPGIKRFLTEVRTGVVPQTLWLWKDVGSTRHSKQELNSIMGDDSLFFGTPKPVQLMERILRIATKPDDTVLDFFAGSGTLGQAVAKLNAEDGGTRRFILVSSTEATEDQPDKNLCRDVCAMRVRRVLGGYGNAKGEQVEGLGGGFAYLRTRRIAPYRLATRIQHDQVWHALQLISDRALTPWQAQGFQHDGSLGYLADFRAASLDALRAWLDESGGAGRTLYTWNPARIAELVPEADIAPIPDFLRARFGR